MIHALLAHDLIDQLTLLTFPIVPGRGKRLFDQGSRPHEWTPVSSGSTPRGVTVGTWRRAGEVPTGSFAPDDLDVGRSQ